MPGMAKIILCQDKVTQFFGDLFGAWKLPFFMYLTFFGPDINQYVSIVMIRVCTGNKSYSEDSLPASKLNCFVSVKPVGIAGIFYFLIL